MDPPPAPRCLEAVLPGFASRVRAGDLLVAGDNFGCGPTCEHAVDTLKGHRVACVIAASFARPFWYSALYAGLPVVVCRLPDVVTGQRLRVDIATGSIVNITTTHTYHADPLSTFAREALAAGGIGPWAAQQTRAAAPPS